MAKRTGVQYIPWQPAAGNPLADFPGLVGAEAYRAIHGFLTNEAEVRAALARIQAAVPGGAPDAVMRYLAAQEARLGFNPQLVTIMPRDRLVKASLFWTWLQARRPIHDLGAGEYHGAGTHRLQWVLVGLWNDGAGRLGPATSVADLYRNLAHANARRMRPEVAEQVRTNTLAQPIDTGRSNPFVSAWDALFDGPFVANATSPEYLCGTFVATQFPLLHAAIRG